MPSRNGLIPCAPSRRRFPRIRPGCPFEHLDHFDEVHSWLPILDTIIFYYISDGETTNGQVRSTFSVLRKCVTTGEVIGVGSQQGGKIEYETGADGQGPGLPERDQLMGEGSSPSKMASSLNEANLKAIAGEISGPTCIRW